VSQISILESKLPHQYDFNECQFGYKRALGRVLLTETEYFFSRGINETLEMRKTLKHR